MSVIKFMTALITAIYVPDKDNNYFLRFCKCVVLVVRSKSLFEKQARTNRLLY